MGKIRNPNPPPKEAQFKTNWRLGAASKRVSVPPAIAPSVMDVARCFDVNPAISDDVLHLIKCINKNPAIANQLVKIAQSLLAE